MESIFASPVMNVYACGIPRTRVTESSTAFWISARSESTMRVIDLARSSAGRHAGSGAAPHARWLRLLVNRLRLGDDRRVLLVDLLLDGARDRERIFACQD